MKRSEMVNLMLEFEREAQGYKCGRQFMDNLLKRMEEEGMLPPEANPRLHIEINPHIGSDSIEDYFYWEHESED